MPEILILSHTWPDLQRFASLKYWIWFFQHHLCHRQCGHQPKHQWLSNVHLDHAVQHSTILIQKIRVNWDSRWANVSVQLRFNIWFGANCFICFCFFLFFFHSTGERYHSIVESCRWKLVWGIRQWANWILPSVLRSNHYPVAINSSFSFSFN